MDEYVGRRVRLLHNTETRGGVAFKKGEVMFVTSHWRGRLCLSSERRIAVNGIPIGINQVNRYHVKLIEGPRVIFLDFDGVLNSMDYFKARPPTEGTKAWRECHDLNPAGIRIVNTILKKTGAKIVVSSTWRHGRTAERLQTLLDARGFEGEVIDITPWHYSDKLRGNEIQEWLDLNPCSGYAIIDDDSDMAHLLPKLVKTKFHEGGLTEDHIPEVLRHFGLNRRRHSGGVVTEHVNREFANRP